MENKLAIAVVIFLMILIALSLLLVFRGEEDSWIRDKDGNWIKHGNPSTTPNYVEQQQTQQQIWMMQQQIDHQNSRISELERDNQLAGSKNCKKHERRGEG